MPYVFVVNKDTFKYHLEYMFAGTGRGNKETSFLINPEANVHYASEDVASSMIADISGIRNGDKIIFYLTSNKTHKGGFFGSFEADGEAFFDEYSSQQYLLNDLKKSLTYRIKIKPNEVYSKGVTEHDTLDSLDGVESPTDLCWSLIYRKLNANRGCTPITNREYEVIMDKIRNVNLKRALSNDTLFTFDSRRNEIIEDPIHTRNDFDYEGNQLPINIKNRLLCNMINDCVRELNLQAYIMQNFDKEPLRSLLFIDGVPIWIANEVRCSVGQQSIDIMSIQETQKHVYINVIELKRNEAYKDIVSRQLPWYIQWTIYYIAEKYEQDVSIQPIILTAPTPNITNFPKLDIGSFKKNKDSIEILPIKYISYTLNEDEDGITFQDYNNETQ